MSSRPAFTSVAVAAVLLLAGLAVAAEAGRLSERTAAGLRSPWPSTDPAAYVRVGTGNVLSEFGPFLFVTITDLGGADGLSVYVTTTGAEVPPGVRFGYYDAGANVWRYDWEGVSGEGAFVSVAPFSVTTRKSAPARSDR